MASSDTGVHARDLAISHQLRFFECLLNALHCCIDVDDYTPLQSRAWRRTKPCQSQAAPWHDFCDHRHDLGGANVKSHH